MQDPRFYPICSLIDGFAAAGGWGPTNEDWLMANVLRRVLAASEYSGMPRMSPLPSVEAAEQDSADCGRHARISQERDRRIRGCRPKSRSSHGFLSQSHWWIGPIADICLSQMGAPGRHRTSAVHHPLCLI